MNPYPNFTSAQSAPRRAESIFSSSSRGREGSCFSDISQSTIPYSPSSSSDMGIAADFQALNYGTPNNFQRESSTFSARSESPFPSPYLLPRDMPKASGNSEPPCGPFDGHNQKSGFAYNARVEAVKGDHKPRASATPSPRLAAADKKYIDNFPCQDPNTVDVPLPPGPKWDVHGRAVKYLITFELAAGSGSRMVSLRDCLHGVELKNGDELVFDKYIRDGGGLARNLVIPVLWPGYPDLQWDLHVNTHKTEGMSMTRRNLAYLIARHYRDFALSCELEAPGHPKGQDPKWHVGKGGLSFDRMKITELQLAMDLKWHANIFIAVDKTVGPSSSQGQQKGGRRKKIGSRQRRIRALGDRDTEPTDTYDK
ncbi:hypothetical protein BDZ97DRAFT_1922614 [Flammula alnicola]|nr:hypothetical protein BDZ97DRAFT_1922614 [Flammula alnicola]